MTYQLTSLLYCCILAWFQLTQSFHLKSTKHASSSHEQHCYSHQLTHNSLLMSSNRSSGRKMGPPLRKNFANDPTQIVGRVSVYCVGAGLNLEGLRAHVFRRGFSGAPGKQILSTTLNTVENNKNPDPLPTDLSDMMLTRSISSEKDIDDEVLHVSNSPLLMNFKRIGKPNINTWERLETPSDLLAETDEVESDAEIVRENIMAFMATQDIFYFDYGCVVFWGLSLQEERAALTELGPFTIDSVSEMELKNSYDQMEYIYDKKANPQRPIRFDRMKVRSLNVEEKLSLSYGMAQSSKLFVLESRVLQSIEMTRYLPKELSIDGKIKASKKDINRLIGKLFVEQTEVNLFSSILDTPDFLWDNDEHLPTYEYIRSYLEVDDRVELLNSRLSVIRELLDVLNAQVAHNNSERLEWIVIWLISVEIILGIFSNPLFVGKRIASALLVPTAVLLFRRINWSSGN